MPARREPERTCVGCRSKGSKAGFIRVVRRPEGGLDVDPTGRAQGRGAYVHRTATCIRLAVRRGSIGRAMKAPLDAAQAARLMERLLAQVGDDR